MTYLVTSEKYQSDDLLIEESIIEIHDGDVVLPYHIGGFEADVSVVVQRMSGAPEYQIDGPIEQTESTEAGSLYGGAFDRPTMMSLRVASTGFAKVRVIVAQVRRGLARAFKGFPCKLCKLAVKTIVSTLLVQLGVPTLPSGKFDLGNFYGTLTTAFSDFANGHYGLVVQSLTGLLPSHWWNGVLNLLHLANWVMDATDAFFEAVCRAIGMCPPKPAVAGP